MSTKDQALVVGGEPRVNLLPPEVAQRKKARSARRGLVALVIVVLLAVAGAYAFVTVQALDADAKLAAAQARTGELVAEQLTYAEVTAISGQVQAVENARIVAASTEVAWNDLYQQIRDRLPAGVAIGSFDVDGRAPWEAELTPKGPLRAPAVATVTFILISQGPIALEPFVAKLSKVEGFADVTPDALVREDDLYGTKFTFNVSAEALSGRFSSEQGG